MYIYVQKETINYCVHTVHKIHNTQVCQTIRVFIYMQGMNI